MPLFSDEDSGISRLIWSINHFGYAARQVTRKGRREGFYAHRMVMSAVKGRPLEPHEIVDHINGIRHDNRRENLRLTDRLGNVQNRRVGKKLRNVFKTPCGRWQVLIGQNYRQLYCGTYDTIEEADRVAAAKRRELGFLGEPPEALSA